MRDTTAPALVVPDDLTVAATGLGGAVVHFFPAASDAADPSPSVSCTPASGSMFPVGTTKVTCVAKDAANNSASASFNVIVAGGGLDLGSLSAGIGIGALIAAACVALFLWQRRKRGPPQPRAGTTPGAGSPPQEPDPIDMPPPQP